MLRIVSALIRLQYIVELLALSKRIGINNNIYTQHQCTKFILITILFSACNVVTKVLSYSHLYTPIISHNSTRVALLSLTSSVVASFLNMIICAIWAIHSFPKLWIRIDVEWKLCECLCSSKAGGRITENCI